MLSAVYVIAAGLLWLALLFGVAVYGERRPRVLERRWALVYALSLAIHCTSWTFYGTVTQASRSGWWLPPTFVGAIALYVVGAGLMVKLVQLAREYNAGSLADLIAARLGRHPGLAALATGVMLLAIVPYIALQLKAVAMSYGVIVRGQVLGAPAWQDSALYVALLMAVFAMLFGTRRASTVEHNRGLVLAVAFESVFKLVAMLALGALLLWPTAASVPLPPAVAKESNGFPAFIVLGALAMFAMPHQFHAGVVECRDAAHVRTARWMFPLYLLLISLPILPLARLGDALLGPVGVPSDLYVLALPLSQHHEGLALLAFLGGLSAATSMVVVATLALSLMVANHFVAPLLMRQGWGGGESGDLRGAVLLQRRLVILGIVLLSWAYSRALTGNDALADIGAISFSALAGLAPATAIAIARPQVGARAVMVGLVAGTLAWLYVLLPVLAGGAAGWMTRGPLGIGWLAPSGLFGLAQWSALGRALACNLVVNGVTVWLIAQSRWGRVPMAARSGRVDAGQLRALAARFLPAERVQDLFTPTSAMPALEARVEHELAAVIGASSARLLLDVVSHRQQGELDTVAEIVGEASRDLRFNQRVLEAALENMSQGICVVDAEQNVVAWNRRYEEIFAYPPGMLVVGRPIAVLTRWNLERGVIGVGDIDARLQRRLQAMRAGTAHLSERQFPDGSMIEIRGNPMPGGGFVATFTDVTAFREAEQELKVANETLEQRVDERTAELARASAAAERANRAKSRFLAAVGHDLAQPLNAAHLFTHALAQQLRHDACRESVARIDGALSSAEDLLGSVLAISRLDSGGLQPRCDVFRLDEWMASLASEFSVLAAQHGLTLRCRARPWAVESDPQLLRRVLQNFLANAVRYTRHGGVLLACRRRGERVLLEVWDTGPGIAESDRAAIFEEFHRIDRGGPGLGLGLAIAERTARLLGHPLTLRSRLGRGTVFAVAVPLARAVRPGAAVAAAATPPMPASRVLVLDNDAAVREAMRALLEGWNLAVDAVADTDEAVAAALAVPPDVLLLDYHLDDNADGLAAWRRLRAAIGARPCAIISADHSEALRTACAAAGCQLLHKPVKPLALKSLLAQMLRGGRDNA
ncbi:MAG TPA: PAS-domain containing protein [Rhodanobacteraceae bacterium]|nr:PAS-domain containing protein [Rhodanobacteraceae bacterium]